MSGLSRSGLSEERRSRHHILVFVSCFIVGLPMDPIDSLCSMRSQDAVSQA
jgi:hypothetical protein